MYNNNSCTFTWIDHFWAWWLSCFISSKSGGGPQTAAWALVCTWIQSLMWPWGVLSSEDPSGMCCQHGKQNQPLGMWMAFYETQNLIYEWVNFSKFLKNQAILLKIWTIGIWMGHFFLKKWYLYVSSFKVHSSTSLPKSDLSTPLDVTVKQL